jgi:hypothetical protein
MSGATPLIPLYVFKVWAGAILHFCTFVLLLQNTGLVLHEVEFADQQRYANQWVRNTTIHNIRLSTYLRPLSFVLVTFLPLSDFVSSAFCLALLSSVGVSLLHTLLQHFQLLLFPKCLSCALKKKKERNHTNTHIRIRSTLKATNEW